MRRPGTTNLPVLMFPDGSVLEHPTSQQVAAKIRLRRRAEVPHHDLVVDGAGPSGLAAAVYGASEGLTTAVLARYAAGG